jgi:hypothetical protein
MKKITNTIKQLSLILGILLALSYSNTLSAQTEEDYYEEEVVEEEEEVSFFGDGINSSRFESKLSSDYESARPNYQYNRSNSNQTNNPFGNENNQSVNDLDVEVHREFSNNPVIIGGGGGVSPNGPNNTPNNYIPGVGNTVSTRGITPPIKGGTPGSYVPDNDGDPDAPIDGGIGFLIAAGIGYGLKQKKSKSQK